MKENKSIKKQITEMAPEMFHLLLKIHVIGKYVLSQELADEIQRIIDKVEK